MFWIHLKIHLADQLIAQVDQINVRMFETFFQILNIASSLLSSRSGLDADASNGSGQVIPLRKHRDLSVGSAF
jgi:hypothetical protein